MKEKAIKTLGRLEATVSVPGSKSYTQRALAIATLAQGRSRLRNILLSEDTHLLIEALRSLGASIELDGVEATVTGTGGAIKNPLRALHLGNNGTGMRLLTALVSLGRGGFLLGGDPRLCERPVDTLLSALQALGVRARSEREDGCPPVAIDAHGLPGGNVILKNIASSQFISALLIAAPYSDQGIGIELRGKVVSMPYVDMTLAVMKEFGVAAETRRRRYYFVRGAQRYVARDYLVEGDVSGASYFFLAAALCGGRVRILNINPKTRQGDLGILKIMAAMGCSVRKGNGWIEITGGNLYGGDHAIDMADMPDMVPTLAVLCAFRKGRTLIRNVSHLRLKESNRIESLVCELRKIGARAEETESGLTVEGTGRLHGAAIETYNDHRIAMSFAVAGLAIPGIRIGNPECVGKSFPGFWHEIGRLTV